MDAPNRTSRGAAALALLALVVVIGGLYAPVFGHGYAFDDHYLAAAQRPDGSTNPRIAEWPGLWTLFSTNYWAGVYPSDSLYRPFTSLSLVLVHQVGGEVAARYQHATNLLLHWLAIWLVYRSLRAIGASRWPAVIGAAVFGGHALHSEVVASVVGRGDLLGLVGGLGACLVLLRANGRPGRLAAGAALALIGFGSKENAVAFAALGPLLLAFFRPVRSRLGPMARDTGLVLGLPLAAFLILRAITLAGYRRPRPPIPVGSRPRPAASSASDSVCAKSCCRPTWRAIGVRPC